MDADSNRGGPFGDFQETLNDHGVGQGLGLCELDAEDGSPLRRSEVANVRVEPWGWNGRALTIELEDGRLFGVAYDESRPALPPV